MTSSALNEWNENPDAETLAYHLGQWKEPYRSTVAFAEFIRPFVKPSQSIADMGCGAGAATDYLARKFPKASWYGFDVSEDLSVTRSSDGFYGVGSGAPIALGALHAGAEPVQAVEIACKLSIYSAGPFQIETQYSK